MSITPDTIRELLHSDQLGDRLRGVNQVRDLEPAIAFDLLQIAIQDTNTRVRYAAVSQLPSVGQVDPNQSLQLLRQQLQDPEPDVQAAAADAIGALQLTAAYEDLAQLYHQTSEWIVRFSILATLGSLGDLRAFDLLAAALQSDNSLEQNAALGSLGDLGDRRAVPLILPFASHEDWQIRHRVAQSLATLEGDGVQTALQTLAQDPVEVVAVVARTVLEGRQ